MNNYFINNKLELIMQEETKLARGAPVKRHLDSWKGPVDRIKTFKEWATLLTIC